MRDLDDLLGQLGFLLIGETVSRSTWMNGMIVPSWLITRPAQAQLLLAGEIPSVRAWTVVGYVFTVYFSGTVDIDNRLSPGVTVMTRGRRTACARRSAIGTPRQPTRS